MTILEIEPGVTISDESASAKQLLEEAEAISAFQFQRDFDEQTIKPVNQPAQGSDLQRSPQHKQEFFKLDPSVQWRFIYSSLARASESLVPGRALAGQINHFHTQTSKERALAVSDDSFEIAMQRLERYPRTQRELLSRAFAKPFPEAWRPVSEREQALLNGWLEKLDSRRLIGQVIAAQERDGLQYTEYEHQGKIERLAEFAGRVLSQGRFRRNHLRGQGSQPAQPGEAILPEVADARA